MMPFPSLALTGAPAAPSPPPGDFCDLAPKSSFCDGIDLNPLHHLASSVIDKVASTFADGEVEILKKLMTFWVDPHTPKVAVDDGHDWRTVGAVHFLQSHTHWLVVLVAVFGLLMAAGKMAWTRRGESAGQVFSGLFTLVVVTGCAAAAVTLAVEAGDKYSEWILDQSSGSSLGDIVAGIIVMNNFTNPGLILVVALLAIISSLAQMALMLVRVAMLGVLTGFLPLGAAATTMPEGKAWFKKMLGWLIAFVLYKPVAATLYAFGFVAIQSDDLSSQLSGVIVIILSVVALPALLRFITPMVSATAGSGGGAAIGGAVGAMGARMVPALGGGSGGGGGSEGGASTGGGGKTESAEDDSPQGAQPADAASGTGPASGGDDGGKGKPSEDEPSGQSSEAAPPTPDGSGGGAPGGAAQGGGAATGEPISTAIMAGEEVVDKGTDVARGAAEDTTGDEGADGSR